MVASQRTDQTALRLTLLLLCLCGLLVTPDAWSVARAAENTPLQTGTGSSTSPQKRALIVALNQYDHTTGWKPLASDTDAVLIRAALNRHGFENHNIQDLVNQQATKDGIIRAFEQYLVEPSREGDILVFHYSGHGQRLTDDNGDELDGYDEALVPYDAPECPGGVVRDDVCVAETYHGERHLRDDELNALLKKAQRKVGPRGDVLVFLDSCYSGTGTRGRARVRGSYKPIGFPLKPGLSTSTRKKEGSGFVESGTTARGRSATRDMTMAPLTVFSAARNDQLAFEMETDDKKEVGSLTYGLSQGLSQFGKGVSYRALFAQVEYVLQGRVSNQPQIEGEIDRELFGGHAVDQVPYVEVEPTDSTNTVQLRAGSLVGLSPGSQVEVHPSGTVKPTAHTKLADGAVVESTPLRATVTLNQAVPKEKLRSAWVFITQYSFGELRTRVLIEGNTGSVDVQPALENSLKKVSTIELVTAEPDVVIRHISSSGSVTVEDARSSATILGPLVAGKVDTSEQIANRLVDYTRNRYLRRLNIHQTNPDVELRLVPVTLKHTCRNQNEPDPLQCVDKELDARKFLSTGGNLELPIGSWFQIRIHAKKRDTHVSVLDLLPDGTIGLLWPEPGKPDKTMLKKGSSRKISALYKVAEPIGSEVILLVATENWLDFEPFVTKPTLVARGKGVSVGPFAPLFNDLDLRSRAQPVYSPGDLTTHAVTVTVRR